MDLSRSRLAVRAVCFLSPAAVALTMPVMGQENRPLPVLPDTVPYVAVSQMPGVQTKWLVGSATGSGVYLFRNRFAAGTQLPPHTHPDARLTQILTGTLHVGFGPVFDSAGTVAVPAGAIYLVPAGVPHYAWAKDGEVVFQETGVGPTANVFLERRPQ